MKTAYFDCIAGASGDMILGALVDSGWPIGALRAELEKLHITDFSIEAKAVLKNGFAATKIDVRVSDTAPERRLADILAVVEGSDLSPKVKERAARVFTRICEAEAGIHRASLHEVHLHEVGGVDAIVDVCGALAGMEALGIESVISSPLPLGRGFVNGAHGRIPLPAPATLALLKGCPVTGSPIEKELVTPTGAALLVELADGFGPLPAMTIAGIGYGAGTRDLVIPNVLRLVIGETPAAPKGYITEPLVQLETNIDSDTPELLGHVSRRLLAAGALDVTLTATQMKKDRPGTRVEVLARSSEVAALENILFTETTTLGIRRLELERDSLPRVIQCILTPHGLIRVKVATLPDGTAKISAEYEDCRAASVATGVPLRRVMRDAEHTAAHQFQLPHTHTPEDDVEPDEFLNP
ncbi:MAG: nickel pincer cofactor biosynthesis protein LarC [Verrucomicrobiales bacterium]